MKGVPRSTPARFDGAKISIIPNEPAVKIREIRGCFQKAFCHEFPELLRHF